jgi:hypothetical protein
MGLGSTVKAIWTLLQGTTNPDVVALYNNLYNQLEGAKIGSSSKQFARNQVGTIYFVNGGADGVTTGNNANNGRTPATAFLTITYALTQCVAGRNDYIYCFNVYNQEPAYPIVVNVANVHIIGVANPDGHQALMVPVGDNPVFEIPLVGGGIDGIEIAGFNLGGGATHGCIEVDGAAYGLWIHNCSFGHVYAGGGQDGIWFIANSCCQSNIIEDCWFWGPEDGQGLLTQFGISAPAATAHLRQCTIRNNFFSKLSNCAISLLGDVDNCVIVQNYIGLGNDVLGDGITLGAFSTGNLVAHNEAARGSNCAATSTNNPFLDQAPADQDNDWISNQHCVTICEPSS